MIRILQQMRPLSEDVDCVSLSRAAGKYYLIFAQSGHTYMLLIALKVKMETMRKEGGDKWLSMLNAEKEQKSHKVFLLLIHKANDTVV